MKILLFNGFSNNCSRQQEAHRQSPLKKVYGKCGLPFGMRIRTIMNRKTTIITFHIG